jgi:hypothetical protein
MAMKRRAVIIAAAVVYGVIEEVDGGVEDVCFEKMSSLRERDHQLP